MLALAEWRRRAVRFGEIEMDYETHFTKGWLFGLLISERGQILMRNV